ncbi:MAG: beta-ketoacyl-[acyl-carrier-protein] synthase family protein [Gemmataceae bacterium]
MRTNESIWITGVGTANPLGNDYPTTGKNLLDGKNGIVRITDFTLPDHLSSIAGRVGQIPTPDCCEEEEFSKSPLLRKLMLWCCSEALEHAGLDPKLDKTRIGISLGLGAEWLFAWEHAIVGLAHKGETPTDETESVLEFLCRKLHLNGPRGTIAAACASANYALAQAREWIRMGLCDVCLAGGGDTFISALGMACFGNLRALSRRNDDPARASRPFDMDRDGFVMGEGGVMFIVESKTHAHRRKAKALAELAGFGASSDAYHMVIPSPKPEPAVIAMQRAFRDAKIPPSAVDYINAHATSSPVGDPAECKVLNMVLGETVQTTPISSTKSMTGHLLSGAAGMNALACIVALENQAVPPTVNLEKPDPACNLRHIPQEAKQLSVQVAVWNSLVFGGSNTTVVFRKAA